MKTLFILALIALAATSTVAQLDITYSQGYGQPWLQWQQRMNPCRQFLQQQCSPMTAPFIRSQMWHASSCQVMRRQCCQQLALISEQSRCQAICSLAQAITQQLPQLQGLYEPQVEFMRMALQSLPSMCNVYVPPYCTTTTTPCSIPTAATCAGGACYSEEKIRAMLARWITV